MFGQRDVPGAGANGHGQPAAQAAGPASHRQAAAVVPLSRPLVTHKGEIAQVPLRMPTWGDVIELGDIDRVYVLELGPDNRPAKMEHTVDRQALERWMVRLSDLTPIILSTLPIQDGRRLAEAVRKLVMAAGEGNSQTGSMS